MAGYQRYFYVSGGGSEISFASLRREDVKAFNKKCFGGRTFQKMENECEHLDEKFVTHWIANVLNKTRVRYVSYFHIHYLPLPIHRLFDCFFVRLLG